MKPLLTNLSVSRCKELAGQAPAVIQAKYGVAIIIAENDFQIRGIRDYRNPFVPVYFGRIQQVEQGTRITGDFRLNRLPCYMTLFVAISSFILMGTTFIAALSTLLIQFLKNGKFEGAYLYRATLCLTALGVF